MTHFANPRLGRRFLLTALGVTLGVCLGAGGAAGSLLRCNVLDYTDRASLNPLNPYDRYLFACSYVWHSLDGGRRWDRVDPHGLPFGARDGYVAVDRQRGRLYLGLLVHTHSSPQCWDCAWKRLRPAIFVSADGGTTWQLSYQFKQGPADNNSFVGLYANPDKAGYVYAVVKNVDEVTFYASGTRGQFWKPICLEFYDVGRTCHLPESVAQFQRLSFDADVK